ncbi:MAG: tRNA pseudouridine(38-40) synthase TruA [Acidimicrobiia bacterium]
MPVVRLDLSYDGSDFHGFARQRRVRTVQGELEEALARVLGTSRQTTCAGRTDAGVHARHQVVTFEVEDVPDLARLRRALDAVMGEEVSIWQASVAPDGFNARFSPLWRGYRYFVDPRPASDPLRRGWVWHLGRDLDLSAMNAAATGLVGSHDFASFCRRRPGASTEREVLESEWRVEDHLAVYSVRARAFCHQMVRSMVGFCVDVGLGRTGAESVGRVIEARDRQMVGTVAPPHGLILWEVGFEV